MSQTIFFSWQNDIPTSVGRNLIERALKDAVRRISGDAAVENAPRGDLHVDRDTQNVPGSPPVFDTIVTKIENAVIFVPDLTFVGARADGRPVPNPNVLMEYGYALRHHGHPRIIAVMNTAYGAPTQENMPFNLGHRRFPIQYMLPGGAREDERSAARAALSRQLESAIRLVFENADFKSSRPEPTQAPHTVLDEAEDYADELDFQSALSALRSGMGLEKVRLTVQDLFVLVGKRCSEINDRTRLALEFEAKPWGDRDIDNFCWLRSGPYATQIYWRQRYANTSDDAALIVPSITKLERTCLYLQRRFGRCVSPRIHSDAQKRV